MTTFIITQEMIDEFRNDIVRAGRAAVGEEFCRQIDEAWSRDPFEGMTSEEIFHWIIGE